MSKDVHKQQQNVKEKKKIKVLNLNHILVLEGNKSNYLPSHQSFYSSQPFNAEGHESLQGG